MLGEMQKNVEVTENRLLDDELDYKKEHYPLAYIEKLKEMERHDEAKDCYRNER